MAQPYFRFKFFTVFQNNSVFKVSTESVLLGGWCEISNPDMRCLDVGCGTGILSLMLIQKGVRQIAAIDIDFQAIKQAKDNFYVYNKVFTSKAEIKLICDDITHFASNIQNQASFDLIISNPPYFSSSLKSQIHKRNVHKHALKFSWDMFFESSNKLLKENGSLVFIFPAEEEKRVFDRLKFHGFGIFKKAEVYYKPKTEKFSRVMVQCKKNNNCSEISEEKINLVDENGKYTDNYKNYVKDFYIHL